MITASRTYDQLQPQLLFTSSSKNLKFIFYNIASINRKNQMVSDSAKLEFGPSHLEFGPNHLEFGPNRMYQGFAKTWSDLFQAGFQGSGFSIFRSGCSAAEFLPEFLKLSSH